MDGGTEGAGQIEMRELCGGDGKRVTINCTPLSLSYFPLRLMFRPTCKCWPRCWLEARRR